MGKLININRMNRAAKAKMYSYQTKKMECAALKKVIPVFAIPLDEIEEAPQQNPARVGGTQHTNVKNLHDDLTTRVGGQVEPICVRWEETKRKFIPVFGYNRVAAFREAAEGGFSIDGSPDNTIWAWVFTGSNTDKIIIQGKENFNKKPGSPGTKDDVVLLLKEFYDKGGFDRTDLGYDTPFNQLSDDEKYDRVKKFVQENWPLWGGRKFQGVWNKFNTGGQLTKFKTWQKPDLAEFYLAHNNRNITIQDVPVCAAKKGKNAGKRILDSGTIVNKGNERICFYFIVHKGESVTLPAHVIRKYLKGSYDRLIVVGCLNNATESGLDKARNNFRDSVIEFNTYHAVGRPGEKLFHEIYWIAQSDQEFHGDFLKGTWSRVDTL